MRRRLPRFLPDAATALSLALCVATAAVWAASYATEPHVSLGVPKQGRYSIRAVRGRLALTGPPPALPADEQAAQRRLADVRNDQFTWTQTWPAGGGTGSIRPDPIPGSPAYRARLGIRQWGGTVSAGFYRALLAALDDPDRFVAAHCLLVYAHTPRAFPWRSFDLPAQGLPSSGPVAYDGLRVELRRDGAKVFNVDRNTTDPNDRWRLPRMEHEAPGSWTFDPAQRAAIRDRWHERLDVPLASFPCWPVVAASLALPALRLHARLRRARAQKAGICAACGYDLRMTPQRCPECGTESEDRGDRHRSAVSSPAPPGRPGG